MRRALAVIADQIARDLHPIDRDARAAAIRAHPPIIALLTAR